MLRLDVPIYVLQGKFLNIYNVDIAIPASIWWNIGWLEASYTHNTQVRLFKGFVKSEDLLTQWWKSYRAGELSTRLFPIILLFSFVVFMEILF